ncbi:hypothetical protein D9619_002571 [Psilocybe cf. subviscida]|uniref:Uncharacterized protein n=1 Tax=Psilocybe cf. subviscida TaxID=2480587 RepID=A0A8H5AX75_9AGAR|nr:hypothetical protein D9619_002571 [Psilocybe cf. subviscida]
MASSHHNKVTQATGSTTLNFVNNTCGGAIIVINGRASPIDYEHISRLLQPRASTSGPPSRASTAPPTSIDRLFSNALALLIPAMGGRIIHDCVINETNNTSGGLIVVINKTSRSCLMPEAEGPSEHADAN